jgi:hypothetical protein
MSSGRRSARAALGIAAWIATGVAAGVACSSAANTAKAIVLADDIPVAHTPDGGWSGEMPPPVLASCTEPLADGVPDLRGTWRAVSVEQNGQPVTDHPLTTHVERIEQCGNRVVITGGRVVHDMRADGTLEHGVNDVATANFTPIQVAAIFRDGKLALFPGGYADDKQPLVTREIVDGKLIFNYVVFKVTMERVES